MIKKEFREWALEQIRVLDGATGTQLQSRNAGWRMPRNMGLQNRSHYKDTERIYRKRIRYHIYLHFWRKWAKAERSRR